MARPSWHVCDGRGRKSEGVGAKGVGLASPDAEGRLAATWNSNAPTSSRSRSPTWPGIETGNVSLCLVDPTAMGNEFAPHTAPIALRVPDVAAAKGELEERGVVFAGEHDTGVCNTAFFSDTEGNALMLHRRYAPVE